MIYDPVGGIYSEPALRSIAWRGRFLVVGFANGEIPKIPLNLTLLKGSSIVGVFWGDYVRREPKSNATRPDGTGRHDAGRHDQAADLGALRVRRGGRRAERGDGSAR